MTGTPKTGKEKLKLANSKNSSESPNGQETGHRCHNDGDYNIGRIIEDVREPQLLQVPQRRDEEMYPAEYPRDYGHIYIYISVSISYLLAQER